MPRSKRKWTIKVHDSDFPELDLTNHGMTAVTYEPLWQGIRVGLSFKNSDSVRRSIAICQSYLDRAVEPSELIRRLVRVRNLLQAIPLYDYRQDGDSVDLIIVANAGFETMLNGTDYYLEWDWNTARKQLPYMYANTYGMFKLMHQSLRHRALRPGPKYALRYFLSMIQEMLDAQDAA